MKDNLKSFRSILYGLYKSERQINSLFGLILQDFEENYSVVGKKKIAELLLLKTDQRRMWNVNENLTVDLVKLKVVLLFF